MSDDLVILDLTDFAGELAALDRAVEPEPEYTGAHDWLLANLNEHVWSAQDEIWRSVETYPATAVISCNNSGKTRIASRIICRWVKRFAYTGTSSIPSLRVVTTAPTAAQVTLGLWQEVRNAYNRARDLGKPLPGRLVMSPFPQWKVGDETVAWGRKPADSAQSAMQGTHAQHVLVVLDEAGGIAQSIWEAVDKITTTGHTSILAIGNPDDPTNTFGKITEAGSGWNVIRVDGLRTPNMTDELTKPYPLLRALMRGEGIPFSTEELPDYMRPVMLSPRWVNDMLVRWCGVRADAHTRMTPLQLEQHVQQAAQASQLFVAAVRGEFPEGGQDSVIPLGWVKRAMERWKDWDEDGRPEPIGRRVVGVDVAGTGEDETACAIRVGDVVIEVHRYGWADTMRTADQVVVHMRDIAQAMAVVDVIGIGSGVADKLRRDGVTAIGFNASAQSDRRDRWGQFRFANDRAAAWWRLREMLDPAGGSTLKLPPDPILLEELCAPKWWVRTGKGVGIIHVESKDDIKKRLGRSTDTADSVIQSVWVDGVPLNPKDGAGRAIAWNGDRDVPVDTGAGGVIDYEEGQDVTLTSAAEPRGRRGRRSGDPGSFGGVIDSGN